MIDFAKNFLVGLFTILVTPLMVIAGIALFIADLGNGVIDRVNRHE